MRILFITLNNPVLNRKVRNEGLFNRMSMFLSSLTNSSNVIDMLIYDDMKGFEEDHDSNIIEKLIEDTWGVKVNVILSKKSTSDKNIFINYIKGLFYISGQDVYRQVSSNTQVESLDKCLSNNPDIIFVHRLRSMVPIIKTKRPLSNIYLDLDDIEHIAFTRSISQPPFYRSKYMYYLHIPALLWGEYKAIKHAYRTFVCSQKDADYLKNYFNLKNICVVSNAVDIPKTQEIASDPVMLFIGGYSYPPNRTAAEFLIDKIWPLVLSRIPNAKLLIAGANSDKIKYYNQHITGIEYTGFVQNLEDLYARTRVICCPILSGGGTRVKLIEAAAYGKPIVSTTIGAEGLALLNGHDVLLRDDAQGFADACCTLLNDMILCKRLGTSARKTAIQNYAKQNVIEKVQDIIFNYNIN